MSNNTRDLLRSGPCNCGDPGCPKCFGEPLEEIDGDALAAEVRRTRDGIIAQAARLIRIGIEDPIDAETVRQVVVALRGLADGLKTGEDALAEVRRLNKVVALLGNHLQGGAEDVKAVARSAEAEIERLRVELAEMTMARDAFAELYKVEESRTASERATAAETEGARLREELAWTGAARDKARAALGVIFDDAELLITPVIAAHVLAHFGRGGYEAGSFTADLIMLIARADPDNRARLLHPFPGYVAAVNLAQNTTTGIDRLAEIAAQDVPAHG